MAAVGYTSGDPNKVDTASVGQVGGPAGPLDASGLIPSSQIPGGGGGGGGGGPSLADTVAAETVYGVPTSAGSATTASRGDHTHGTPPLASTTPSASAVGDAAATGIASTPARADHVHGREPFGSVAAQTTYGAASGDGTATTPARSDHTHGTPALASTAPSSSAVGDAAAVGSATAPARADHVHGRESFGAVTAQTTYGASSGDGTAATPARSDHTHGTPAVPTASQVGAVPADSTVTVAPSAPLVKHQRNFAVDSSAQNIAEFWVNNALRGWINEWGGYRGTPNYAWDAVIRMIAASGQTGNILEYQNNPRTQVLFGISAAGRVVMGNGSAAAVTMAPVYVAPASAVLPGDLPAGLPAGTVVIQLAS